MSDNNMQVWQSQLELYGKISGTLWVWSLAAMFAGIGVVAFGSIFTVLLFACTSLIWWAHAVIVMVNVFKSMNSVYTHATTWKQTVHG